MRRCLELAQKGTGYTAPNPLVGAVLVHKGQIIGEGWHKEFGGPHAEVNCIESVPEDLRSLVPESRLYVSLEPCSHFGKTPPCTDLIIEKKIKEVFIGCRDSNKKVDGIGKLKKAGVTLNIGLLEKKCRELNKRFFTYHEKNRPYVVLKWAKSKNGFIANIDKSRVHISNEETNKLVHKWRSEEAAILVGFNTAKLDDPQLTVRSWKGKNPVRVVIDKNGSLPGNLKIFNSEASTEIIRQTEPAEILAALYNLNLNSVLIEGGTQLLQSFIDAGLWDEARVITNEELVIENGYKAPFLANEIFVCNEKHSANRIDHFVKKTF